MAQHADVRPDPSLLRKATLAQGGVKDHAGDVVIKRIPNFDLGRTIFDTLESKAARFVIKTRLGKEPQWKDDAAKRVKEAYRSQSETLELPEVSAELLEFMVKECDFDVEHADGSFLDHLYFGFEYSAHYFPSHPPLVMLLHSILGTGTNTFAMDAHKIPALQALMSTVEWTHVEAFPSLLRLLYDFPLRKALHANLHRPDALERIDCHRVIDNEKISLSGDEFWTQLNYQLIHLVDFLPAANWHTHKNDTSFILFRDLYDLLQGAGKLEAKIEYSPVRGARSRVDEVQSLGAKLTTLIPVSMSEKMAASSVAKFSERIGHSLNFTLHWT